MGNPLSEGQMLVIAVVAIPATEVDTCVRDRREQLVDAMRRIMTPVEIAGLYRITCDHLGDNEENSR